MAETAVLMEKLIIEQSDNTPYICFNSTSGTFEIRGKCIPTDGKRFFAPVLEWLEKYLPNPASETHLVVNLEYFNISSSKMLLFILYKLNDLYNSGKVVTVSWHYNGEDDEMFEVGEDYAFMVNIPFTFIHKKVLTAV